MTDLNCVLAGLIRLLSPFVLLFVWYKKARVRLFPALVAYGVCLPVFIVGAAIRSGFQSETAVAFYVQQGLLYGILEEGTKYLVLRFLLGDCDSRKDAVTYAIGHGAYEEIPAGLTCFGLIGTGNAAPDIFWFNLLDTIEGSAFVIALTVIILYGIRTGRSKITLPAAILLHALSSAAAGLELWIGIRLLLFAGSCYAAYRCWKALDVNAE